MTKFEIEIESYSVSISSTSRIYISRLIDNWVIINDSNKIYSAAQNLWLDTCIPECLYSLGQAFYHAHNLWSSNASST